jgi:hypothetical protein
MLAHGNRRLVMNVFPFAPPAQTLTFGAYPPAPAIDPDTDGFALDSPMFRGLLNNRGVLRCNEPLQLAGAVDATRPILFADGQASISRVQFTPNRIEFAVITRGGPGRVFMNQRYVAGWGSTAGPIAIDEATQLPYVAIPATTTGSYSFTFAPKGLVAGLLALMLGLALAAATWRRRL